jgi:predicted DNA-binding transcriptional regulator YafY
MRADRLITLILLIQNQTGLTASQLARELEVSERTIYRDIDALSSAGVPVYTERGPGGGIFLAEAYRTSLTGLNPNEIRALYMLGIPTALAQLGIGQDLRGALLKLSASLPASRREEESRTRQRIYLDPAHGFHTDEPTPMLKTVHQAVWHDQCLKITLRLDREAQYTLTVEPYGLVAKADQWHLISRHENHFRVNRVSQILLAEKTGKSFVRDPQFDLPAFWESWRHAGEAQQHIYPVKVQISARLLEALRVYAPHILNGTNIPDTPDPTAWIDLVLFFENFFAARKQLLAYGGAVKVVEPRQLRLSIIDFAQQVLDLYQE